MRLLVVSCRNNKWGGFTAGAGLQTVPAECITPIFIAKEPWTAEKAATRSVSRDRLTNNKLEE